MAPRRLVLAMILLLAASTVVAIIAPNPSERSGTDAGSTSQQKEGTRESAEQTTSDPSREPVDSAGGPGPRPRAVTVKTGGGVEVIPVEPDLRLVLEVRSGRTTEIAIPELGRTATADRWAPAVFDLVTPDQRGSLTVEDLSSREPVARIVIP